MKEIKFRAWNPYTKAMEDIVYLTPAGRVNKEDGEDYDFPVMQYTGLKDKNGKEIYDGDIINHDSTEAFLAVTWNAADATFECRSLPQGNTVMHDAVDVVPLGYGHAEEMTVVGNIYESPELLK